MQQTLFLMVGFPGSGKTTIAKIIQEQTGAVHLWADAERRKMFKEPTHSHEESRQLYDYLNEVTDTLLGEGKSVVFDTNFNFRKDRDHLRGIAAKHGARTVVVWITTPKDVAKQRAVFDRELRNNYEFILPEADFERMSNHLQPPADDEHPVKLEGIDITPEKVAEILKNLD